jgi:predicted ATPase
MSAAVEWSYALLSNVERKVLHCLAQLDGQFSFDTALAAASDDEMVLEQVRSVIIALANKSLLSVSQQVSRIQYRLLATTRAYVLQQHQNMRASDPACTGRSENVPTCQAPHA